MIISKRPFYNLPFILILPLIVSCEAVSRSGPTAANEEPIAWSTSVADSAAVEEGEAAAAAPSATDTIPAATATPPAQPTLQPTTIAIATADRPTETPAPTETATPLPTAAPTDQPLLPTATVPFYRGEVIGSSLGGHPIELFKLGRGELPILVIGGIHGGYEWNTIILAYQIIDYFAANPALVPDHVTLIVIPSANPDGQVLVTDQPGRFSQSQVQTETRPGRFNSNGVDLNRNWECDWAQDTVWGSTRVQGGGGRGPYSEMESFVLRNYILDQPPQVAIFLHSAAGGIFPGRCNGNQVPDTIRLAEVYSAGSGYPLREGFNAYVITGESSDSLNLWGIPAFTVELYNHTDTDFTENVSGLLALFETPLGEPIVLEPERPTEVEAAD